MVIITKERYLQMSSKVKNKTKILLIKTNNQRHEFSVTLLTGLSHPTRGTYTLPSCWVALPSLPTGAQLSTVLPIVPTRTTCRKKTVFIHKSKSYDEKFLHFIGLVGWLIVVDQNFPIQHGG